MESHGRVAWRLRSKDDAMSGERTSGHCAGALREDMLREPDDGDGPFVAQPRAVWCELLKQVAHPERFFEVSILQYRYKQRGTCQVRL